MPRKRAAALHMPVEQVASEYLDADAIIARLEEAGMVLLAMRLRSPYPAGIGTCMPEPIRDFWEAYNMQPEPLRAALPSARDITRMEETLSWVPRFIPADRHVVRRIVHARALVSWKSGRPIYTWRQLGVLLHANDRAVQRWHSEGIGKIVSGVNRLSY